MSKRDFIKYMCNRFDYAQISIYKIIAGENKLSLAKALQIVDETDLTLDDLLDLKTYFKNQKLKKG